MLDTKELPPEVQEERKTPTRSQDELIADFVKLDAQVRELGLSRRDVAMQLAGIAWECRGEQRSTRIASSDGQKIKVDFGQEFSYETDLMRDVVNLLGSELFDSLFKTEIVFTARKRELKAFMNTRWPEEAKETAKKIIKEATSVRDKSPYVTIE